MSIQTGRRKASQTGDAYLTRIRRSNIDEVREIVRPDPENDRRFAAVARISEVNLACYRSFVQPWMRALVTDQGAKWLEPLHPLRMGYELWSDRHPLAAAVHEAAQHVRDHRQPVSEANPFLQLQAQFSTAVEQMLDQFRDCRDQIYAQAFDTLYSLPLVQAMTGQSLHDDAPPRPHPSETPEHRQYLAQELTRLEADIHSGGLAEAAIRALFFVLAARGEADGRHFRHAEELVRPHWANDFDMQAFRHLVRRQALLMRLDEDATVSAIPGLLNGIAPDDIRQVAGMIAQVIGSGDALSAQEQARLEAGFYPVRAGDRRAQAASAPAVPSPPMTHALCGRGHETQDLLAKAEGASKDNRVQDASRAADKTNTARERHMTTSPKPVDATADAWHVLRNRTFDEIAIGDSASLERAFSPQDIHMFALQSGDVDPEPAVSSSARDTTEAICANVLISAVLGTRLPGPGTQYVSQNLCFLGAVRPGDRLTVQMQVTSKDTATHHVTLACTCTNQEGVAVFQGQVEVVAPTERIERTRTALPEIHPDAQGRTGLQHLLAHVAHLQPIRVAVAHPCDAPACPPRSKRATRG
jgi:acyl dehydratase